MRAPKDTETLDGPEHSNQSTKSRKYDARSVSSVGVEEDEQTKRTRSLHQSTYDAVLFAACRLEDSSMKNGFWEWFQFVFATLLQLVAVGLQFTLTFLLFATVVEESERAYEDHLGDDIMFLAKAVSTGETLDRHSDLIKLCRRDHTVAGVHTIVVLVWVSRMIGDIMEAAQTMWIYFKMSSPPPPADSDPNECEIIEEQLQFRNGVLYKESYDIKNLTMRLRVLSIVFLGLTKVSLAMLLTFTSAKFLILSGNMARVILKAVSMQFIVSLDELIFKAFAPKVFAQKISAAQLFYGGRRPALWKQWSKSVGYVIIAIVMTFGLTNFIFSRLHDFRIACRNYYIAFPHERSAPMSISMAISHVTDEFLRWMHRKLSR